MSCLPHRVTCGQGRPSTPILNSDDALKQKSSVSRVLLLLLFFFGGIGVERSNSVPTEHLSAMNSRTRMNFTNIYLTASCTIEKMSTETTEANQD